MTLFLQSRVAVTPPGHHNTAFGVPLIDRFAQLLLNVCNALHVPYAIGVEVNAIELRGLHDNVRVRVDESRHELVARAACLVSPSGSAVPRTATAIR